MEKQFYVELELARQKLMSEIMKQTYNVQLRVTAEDVSILIGHLIQQQCPEVNKNQF